MTGATVERKLYSYPHCFLTSEPSFARCREKHTFWVSHNIRHKPVCKTTENDWKFEISDFETRQIILHRQRKAMRPISLRGSAAGLRLRFPHMLKAGYLMTRLLLKFLYGRSRECYGQMTQSILKIWNTNTTLIDCTCMSARLICFLFIILVLTL